MKLFVDTKNLMTFKILVWCGEVGLQKGIGMVINSMQMVIVYVLCLSVS